MFGLSKRKEIDQGLLKQNVSEAILNIWSNPRLLELEKFASIIDFANTIKPGSATPARFFTEKLRLTTSVALILLTKSGVEESIVSDIIGNVKKEASGIDQPEVKGASTGLGLKAKEYSELRFSAKPSVAGKLIESKFSDDAFGYIPSDSDINRRYTLYKSLSSFERSAILEISNAISKSRR